MLASKIKSHYNIISLILLLVTIVLCVWYVNKIELEVGRKIKIIGTVREIKKTTYQDQIIIESNHHKYLIETDEELPITLKDTVTFQGTVAEIEKATMPNIFNPQSYWLGKGVIGKLEEVTFLEVRPKDSIKEWLYQKIANHPLEGYMASLLLSDFSRLEDAIVTAYQQTGLIHLLGVSGTHIVLIDSLFRRFSFPKWMKWLFLSVYFYLLYPNFAFTRSFIYHLLPRSKTYGLAKNFLAISIALWIDPFALFSVGFYYASLLSTVAFLLMRKMEKKKKIKELLSFSLWMFLFQAPLTIYFYFEVNVLSLFIQLVMTPLLTMFLFPSVLITFAIPILTPITTIIVSGLDRLLLWLSSTVSMNILFGKPSIAILVLTYALLFLALIIFQKRKRFAVFLCIFAFLLLSGPKGTDEVVFLDVGQGDSIWMRLDDKTILIDTGCYKQKQMVSFLKSKKVSHLDYLILTHGDYDHMGEAINLVENFKVEKVIFNCGELNDLEKELIEVLGKKKIPYYSCIKELNIDNNKLYFLQTKEYDNENNNSNVIYIELDGYKFMFMGDSGIEKEKDILDKYNISDIDVLKVGHHGSKTSSDKKFIDEIKPKYSIISVGKNNRYGHPNKEVLDTLNDSKIYRTDQDGSIMFRIKKDKLQIETCSP